MAAMRGNIDVGALQQQVIGIDRGHSELRKELHGLESKVDAGFLAIAQKLDQKTTTQWQPIGILVTVLLAIGGALYWPVREAISKQELQIEATRRDLIERDRIAEGRVIKLWDDHNRTARDLAYLQGQLHPLPAPAVRP